MAFCRLFVCNIVVLCVIHNSVGSALLVLTVDGHTRASMRGTSDSTVPTLFLFSYIIQTGDCCIKYGCYYENATFKKSQVLIPVIVSLVNNERVASVWRICVGEERLCSIFSS